MENYYFTEIKMQQKYNNYSYIKHKYFRTKLLEYMIFNLKVFYFLDKTYFYAIFTEEQSFKF